MTDSNRSRAARKAAQTKGPRKMARAGLKALSHFASNTLGHEAMSRQGRMAARARTAAERSAAARRAAATKGAGIKAARTRRKSSP